MSDTALGLGFSTNIETKAKLQHLEAMSDAAPFPWFHLCFTDTAHSLGFTVLFCVDSEIKTPITL